MRRVFTARFIIASRRLRFEGMNELGKVLVVVGVGLALVGAFLWAGFGKWLGRMPGDIHYTRDDFSFHFPIVTCLLISLVLTLIIWLLRR
jgi:drug/metabolite transporter (DMT)-like permease